MVPTQTLPHRDPVVRALDHVQKWSGKSDYYWPEGPASGHSASEPVRVAHSFISGSLWKLNLHVA